MFHKGLLLEQFLRNAPCVAMVAEAVTVAIALAVVVVVFVVVVHEGGLSTVTPNHVCTACHSFADVEPTPLVPLLLRTTPCHG